MNNQKPKTCRVCKVKFTPSRAIQPCCGYDCNVTYALALHEKKEQRKRIVERRETKVKLEKLKTRQEYLKDAQRFFNFYIRLRDKNLPCISCGRFHNGQYHAGHYRTIGAVPSLRFIESNVHKQCAPCNNHLSGNITLYRKSLVEKVGHETLAWLESNHEPKHYTIEEIKAIKVKYKNMIKEITK